jgi:hypothetical protein
MKLGSFAPGTLVAALLLILLAVAPAGADDVIRFQNGRSVSGRIVEENDRTVTIEIAGSGRLTVPRKDIAEIVRDEAGAEEPGAGNAVRSEHFLVWSGKRRVGTRALRVRERDGGGFVLEEESTFTNEKGEAEVRIRIVETVTEALAPVEIVYRESSEGGQTLLHGVVRDDALDVTVTDPSGRRESKLPLPRGLRFPLAAREFAVRERERLKGAWEVKVFDPREENFFRYRFESGGKTRVDWEGEIREVNVVIRHRASRAPEEIWLDASGGTLSEELNGPELVAVRTSRDRFDALMEGAEVAASPEEERVRPLFVDRNTGFRIRKPSLSWTFESKEPGDAEVLSISNLRWFAYVDVFVFPDEPEGGLLSSLAVDMERRFSGSSENFEKISQGFLEVGGEKAVRIVASSTNNGEELRSWLVGVLHGGRTWLLAMACPKAYWKGAEPEFEQILEGFGFLR